MKAHTENNEKQIILSIGMIIKNEEKVLERCLKSLQPLMKAIPSELIIADTGSTDSSVEIAKKYTDNVFHFEWINDFAAARNSTLNRAKGQWYMFIDADEYLDEDISEMIEFFSIPELCVKYKTLEITIRNYTDTNNMEYLEAMSARFFNRKNKIQFIGAIHETIEPILPICRFSTILHHTGYVYKSSDQHLKKITRNIELMREEYRHNPRDLRLLSHIIDGSGLKTEEYEKEKYISEALMIVRNDLKHPYSRVIFFQAIAYFKEANPEYALKLCEEYERYLDKDCSHITTIAIKLAKALLLTGMTRYNHAIECFKEYFALYDSYRNSKLNMSDFSIQPMEALNYYVYIKSICTAAIILSKTNKNDEALKILNDIDINNLDNASFKNVLGTIREICQNTGRYDVLSIYHNKVVNDNETNDLERKSLALYMMESTYYSIVGDEKRKQYAKAVVDTNINTNYSELMKLVLNQDKEKFDDSLSMFIDSIDNWQDGYTEAIYLAVKYGLDISKTIDKMNPSTFREKLEIIAVHHDDFAGYVLDYGVPEGYMQNIKRFYWITSLYEKASYRSFELNDNDRYALYLKFVELLGEYVFNIYNTELLEDESDTEVLPMLHRFGYYMHRANQKLNEGNAAEYIREMKKALEACESMREIVQFMLDQFRKMMKMS